MEKGNIVACACLLGLLCFTSCNYILHPTKNYNYSTGKLTNASRNERDDFKAIRKELHSRGLGENSYVTYDYFRIPRKLSAPSDTADFRKYTIEIVLARLSYMNIDSLRFERLSNSDSLSMSKGGREFMDGGGIMFWNRAGKQSWGWYTAAWVPGKSADIIQISTHSYYTKKD